MKRLRLDDLAYNNYVTLGWLDAYYHGKWWSAVEVVRMPQRVNRGYHGGRRIIGQIRLLMRHRGCDTFFMEFVAIDCQVLHDRMRTLAQIMLVASTPTPNVQTFTVTIHTVRPCSLEDSLVHLLEPPKGWSRESLVSGVTLQHLYDQPQPRGRMLRSKTVRRTTPDPTTG